MPAKLTAICYVYEYTQRSVKDYNIKEVTGILKLNEDEPTEVVYLKIKAFIPLNKEIETHIEEFETGEVILLKGKFIACDGWYTVNATSIQPITNLDYDTMPAIGMSVMLSGSTTQTVKNVDGQSILEFSVEENLGDREPKEFLLEMRHNANANYLANKTNSINQTMRSTTAILTGLLYLQRQVVDNDTGEVITPLKHILKLDDISLISSNRTNTATHSVNLPWMSNQEVTSGKTSRTPRGSTPRPKRARVTLSQVSPTRKTRSQSLASVLQENPPPNMNQNNQNETSSET